MAQIVFPNDFSSQCTLLDDVIKQNADLGTKSPLVAWLKAKNIDLQAYKKASGNAQTCETQRVSNENVSEQSNQERDELFKLVFQFVMQGAQALKKWYKPTYALLKDWGVPITASGRIDYPSSFEDRSAIATLFFAQYDTYEEDANPLAAFVTENETDVALLKENLADALKKNVAGTTNAKLAENATAERNKYMAAPLAGLRAIGDYLKSLYVKNPRMLGEWGYVVDESTATAKPRKAKFIIGETRVIDNIAIGSIIVNKGKSEALIYKGKSTDGEVIKLKVDEKMGIIKGYSAITVTNSSTLETLELSILPPEN